MIQRIIHFSVNQKFIVGLLVLVLIGLGIHAMFRIPINAVPDITNNQVQVVTVSPSLAAQEVEQLITYPVEVAMANLPDVVEVRSISRYSLSVVTIVFDDHVPILDARQLVKEQISVAASEIPTGLGSPELMPITTGLGEIYQYTVEAKPGYEDEYDAMELRTIQDWIVKRQLAGIQGIVEISSFGGYLKQYEVAVDPQKMRSLGVTIPEVIAALERNNENSGGSYLQKQSNAFYIRTSGRVHQEEDIRQVFICEENGVPVLVKDIAEVGLGSAPRYGAMTHNGVGEAVGGITLMLKGANSSKAINAVKERIEQVQKSLPEGVVIKPYLDRAELVRRTIMTVSSNLIEGGLIVILVLVFVSGNLRAGLIVASVIPLSMLFALIMMQIFNVSANLMSLGAIDFGIVVDGTVVIVENILYVLFTYHMGKRLSQDQMDQIVADSATTIYRAASFGILVILVVFLPIMTLTGIEGKMFRPMAYSVSFAVFGALLLSLTYVPMMSAWLLNKHIKTTKNLPDRIMAWLRERYRPLLKRALLHPYLVILIALSLLGSAVFVFDTLGAEFIPTLEEGDLAMQMTIQPGSSLNESIGMANKAERILLKNFPEVKEVISKIGTAEVPTDPMAIEDADIMIILKDKAEWVSASTREGLAEAMKEKLNIIAGAEFEFTQPIQLRFNELMTGAKTDVAVKIFGEDLQELAILGRRAEEIISGIPGAADVRLEQTEGLPQLLITYDRSKIAQYGLNIQTLNTIIRSAYAGETAGVVFEGERKFDLVVRLQERYRGDLDLSQLFVTLPDGSRDIPLSEVATYTYQEGPMQISRNDARRQITVGVNVRNRDVASLVSEIEQELDARLDAPPGYYVRYGGQFENLRTAQRRLMVAVPAAMVLILILLYFAFSSIRYALLIFTAVPLSAIGGIVALWVRDMPFSISAWIGFITLFGVSVTDGIVILSQFNALRKEEGKTLKEAIVEGGSIRLRPVLMTSIVAALGFLPMALSTSAGAEVQKPLATVVIGGIISATILTLLVLPVLYYLVNRKSEQNISSTPAMMILIFLVIGSTAQIQAQEQEFSLEFATQYAIEHHPLISQSELTIQREQALRKGTFQLPPLQVMYQYGEIDARENDYSLNVSQSLGSLLEHSRRRNYQDAAIDLAEAERNRLIQQVRYQVALAWQDWRYRQQLTTLYLRQSRWYDELATRATVQREVGEIEPLDYRLVTAQQNEVERKLLQAGLKQEQAASALRRIAFWEDDLIPSADSLIPLDDQLINHDMSLSYTLMAPYEKSVYLNQQEIQLQRSQFFPSISVGYFIQELEDQTGLQGVTLGVSIPLWRKPIKSQIQSASISTEIAERELAYQQYQQKSLMAQAWENVISYREQYNTLGTSQLELASEVRNTAQTQLQAGEVDYFRYVQSLDKALEWELSYWKLLHEYNQSIITLKYYLANEL